MTNNMFDNDYTYQFTSFKCTDVTRQMLFKILTSCKYNLVFPL